MDSIKRRTGLIKSLERALVQLDKLIVQEINLEELDPEKAKAAAQGKIEAAKGFVEMLGMISEQQITIENEQNAAEGKTKGGAFTGVEDRSK